jgi:hypothetical protein
MSGGIEEFREKKTRGMTRTDTLQSRGGSFAEGELFSRIALVSPSVMVDSRKLLNGACTASHDLGPSRPRAAYR